MSITVKNTAVDKIVFFFQNSASVRPQKVLEHGVMDVHRTRGLMDPLWRGHGHTGAGFGLFTRLANRKKDIFFSRLYPVDLQTWTHDYDFSVIYADLILNWQMYLNAMRDFTACGGTRCARVKINAHMPLPSVSFHSPLYTDSWCLFVTQCMTLTFISTAGSDANTDFEPTVPPCCRLLYGWYSTCKRLCSHTQHVSVHMRTHRLQIRKKGVLFSFNRKSDSGQSK